MGGLVREINQSIKYYLPFTPWQIDSRDLEHGRSFKDLVEAS